MISPKDIADMFAELEIYLIQSFKRNLKRHKDWEKEEGFEWSAWQAEKLRELNIFRRQNKTIAKNFISRILPDTRQMLIEQYKEGSDTTPSFFGINERRLNALIDEMQTIEQDVTKAALRNIDDAYRSTVLKAAAALNSGTMTVNQAVDMASREFLAKGINCVQYKDGRRVNIVSYAEMALRTNATRSRLYGQRAKMKELGIDTVIISQYGGCSPTCLPWQGKVYIDDVFCDFDGKKGVGWGISNNGNTYMLLSHAVKNGLFHPNCRHNARIYREGITRIRPPLDKDTVNKNYALEQQQHKLERRVRRAKRLEAGTLDPEKKKEYTAQRKAAQKQLREFIKEHDDVLRRDLWREKVSFVERPPVAEKTSEENGPMTLEEVKEFMTKQVLSLPDEHKDVLQRYTGALATRVNNAIKNNRINAQLQKEIALLDEALKDGVMPETIVLHRDTVFDWLGTGLTKNQLAEDMGVLIDTKIVNPIFTSTSFENLQLTARDTELIITVPKGYKGCQYLKPIALEKYKNQEEVLFSRGLSYMVKSAKMKNKKIILEVEVLPNE